MARASGATDAGGRWRRLLLAPVEFAFTLAAHSRPLAESRGTFLVAFRRYVGRPFDLPDGAHVQPGDRLCEIHFWNRRIAERKAATAGKVTWRFIHDFRADLGTLARAVASGSLGEVRFVYAASPLAQAAARFGFAVRPLPAGLRRAVLTAWQTALRRAFRPRALHSEIASPTAEIWMSAAQLIDRYGGGSPAPTTAERAATPAAGAGRSPNL